MKDMITFTIIPEPSLYFDPYEVEGSALSDPLITEDGKIVIAVAFLKRSDRQANFIKLVTQAHRYVMTVGSNPLIAAHRPPTLKRSVFFKGTLHEWSVTEDERCNTYTLVFSDVVVLDDLDYTVPKEEAINNLVLSAAFKRIQTLVSNVCHPSLPPDYLRLCRTAVMGILDDVRAHYTLIPKEKP